jgi:hypothetical protein
MKITLCLILLIVSFALGCSDEYNPVATSGGGGGTDTTIVIKPEPTKPDSIYVVKDVNLTVCPNRNDDHEVVYLGLDHAVTCDVYALAEWNLKSEGDMTLWVNDQPYALPQPMDGSRTRLVHFTGISIKDPVSLSLVLNKGSIKKPQQGCDQKSNQVTKVVFTTVGLREP